MRKLIHCVGVIVLLAVMLGCKPEMPSKYLQPNEMADILFDYHLAEGVQSVLQKEDTLSMRAYEMSILNKHKVSKADFDSSLVYYTRHTELLDNVYDKVTERLNRESAVYGGTQLGMDGELANNSDTMNIWPSSPSKILSPYAGVNRFSFEVKADTSYHDGDKVMLDFDAQFIYQDGMRDAMAVLAVTYDNDSIEVVNNPVSSSSHYHLQIKNSDGKKIKAIRGFMLHNNTSSTFGSSKTTLRLLVITNIKLIRMHVRKSENSLSVDSAKVYKEPNNERHVPDSSKMLMKVGDVPKRSLRINK